MCTDTIHTSFELWSCSWLSPTTIVAVLGLLFMVYKYWRQLSLNKPVIVQLSVVFDNDKHIVTTIANNSPNPIPHPKFYVREFFFGFIPFKKQFLRSEMINDVKEDSRYDSTIPRATFKGEQLFWLYTPQSFKFRKGNSYIFSVLASTGHCSAIYHHRLSIVS